MLVEYVCKNCGKTFLADHAAHRVFCSKDCLNEYRKTHPEARAKRGDGTNLIEVVCAECGKHEIVYRSRAEHYVCCSRECFSKYKKKHNTTSIEKICPICEKHFFVKPSQAKRRVCCSQKCVREYQRKTRTGENNPNYRAYTIENGVKSKTYKRYKEPYRKIARDILGVKSVPKGYDIHHKNADENDHRPENLVALPRNVHMLIHRWFGNILINALHNGKISREIFFSMCNDEQKHFYEQIIDLDILHQEVVKQGELLGNPEVDNQQPSIYRNIYEGSTTNIRPQTDSAVGSNDDTSALPIINNNGDDIV